MKKRGYIKTVKDLPKNKELYPVYLDKNGLPSLEPTFDACVYGWTDKNLDQIFWANAETDKSGNILIINPIPSSLV